MANLDKFNRTNFLLSQVVDGTNEWDLLSNSLNDFKFSLPMSNYKVRQEDIGRPDLIAIKMYQDVNAMNYWHIIMFVNKISDPWNDILPGDLLKTPDKRDLENFITFNKNR